jgi:hypothetical protein
VLGVAVDATTKSAYPSCDCWLPAAALQVHVKVLAIGVQLFAPMALLGCFVCELPGAGLGPAVIVWC